MFLTCDCLQLQDLEELSNTPLYPVIIDTTSVYDAFTSDLYVRDVTPLGPKPRLSRHLPFWFNQLVEFADYIDPVLPRRFENA